MADKFKDMFKGDEAPKKQTDKAVKKSKPASSREGKKGIIFYPATQANKQLKLLAVEEDKTQQALMTEALNDLFKKYKKPQVA